MTRYDADLRLALDLADAADAISMRRFGALDLHVETKPDLTPVSDADRAVETELRRLLRGSRPQDAVLGEEQGLVGTGSRRWVIDPIDGTKNFVRGVPVWATLVGLLDGDEPVVGVASAPALGRRWWAATGSGAFVCAVGRDAVACQVSAVSRLADASLSYSGIGGWAERGRLEQFLDLAQRCWRTRAYGDFWSHLLVAEGAVDAAIEPEVSLWDLAAVAVIVTEAGGRLGGLDGVSGPGRGDALTTNGRLHDEVLAVLQARSG